LATVVGVAFLPAAFGAAGAAVVAVAPGSAAGVVASVEGSAAGADSSAGAGEAASVWSALDCDESSVEEPPEQPAPTRANALSNAT
jgi:hypothetical protein